MREWITSLLHSGEMSRRNFGNRQLEKNKDARGVSLRKIRILRPRGQPEAYFCLNLHAVELYLLERPSAIFWRSFKLN